MTQSGVLAELVCGATLATSFTVEMLKDSIHRRVMYVWFRGEIIISHFTNTRRLSSLVTQSVVLAILVQGETLATCITG